MLELKSISKAFAEGRQVLSNLTYTLKAGEYVAIMGESGIGKSTLLNIIAGLDAPDSGEVLIDGIQIATLDDESVTILRRKVIWLHLSGISYFASSDAWTEYCVAIITEQNAGGSRRKNADRSWAAWTE